MPGGRRLRIEALPHQWELWNDYTDRARIGMFGGLGTGKTESLVIKDLLLHLRNVQVKGRGFRAMLVEPTYGMVHDILIPAFEEIIRERHGIPIQVRGSLRPTIIWPREFNGSQTMLRSAEKPKRLAGPNLSHVGFDEPGQMEFLSWKRGADRARHPGAAQRQVFAVGSPEGLGWCSALFDEPKPPYKTIRAREWHSAISYYPLDLTETYKDDPAQLASYLDGLFVPMFGRRCYLAFDDRFVVRQPDWPQQVYNPHEPLHLSCDFNIDAMRWNVYQVVRGRVHALDEIALGFNGTIAKAAEVFRERYHPEAGTEQRHRGPIIVGGDASGGSRDFTGKTAYDEVLSHLEGVWLKAGQELVTRKVLTANPAIVDRVRNVNRNFALERVWIAERCSELILDMKQNAWAQTGVPEIEKKQTAPDNQRTHAGDNLGYLLWQHSRVYATGGKRKVRSGRVAPGITW